jgi:phosphatidylserine decarboxylase
MQNKQLPVPLTRYGLRELIIMPIMFFALALVACFFWPDAKIGLLVTAGVLTLLGMAFFRDFERAVPNEPDILIAPADGTVTDICEMEESDFIQGPVIRIGIFLSVLDVHVNRIPCSGKVMLIKEKPGKCLNAMRSEDASQQNQSTSLGLDCPDHPAGKILVRQITGAIARRIVCATDIGDNLVAGQRYGMIKFGSRTELYLPRNEKAQVLVKKGDKVRGGLTIFVRYRDAHEDSET